MCNVYGLLGCVWSLVYPTCMIQFCISLLLFISSLIDKVFNQNPKNLFYLILFYEIVLACSLVVWEQFLALTSLASLPGMKLKYIFPGISLFIWFWEVNKIRKYFRVQFFTDDSTIKDSTARRILLTDKWRSQMERLGITLLVSSVRFFSYSSVLSYLSHWMSK